MDSMDDASAVPWSGSAFLASVGGTADAFPPARVLFLISRLRTSGRIWLTHLADIRTIDFTDGEVVACSGFSDLLKEIGVSGEYGEGLADMLTRAVADGHSEEQVAKVAAQALGTWMVEHTGDTGLIVQFAPDSPAPDLPLAQPICTMKVLLEGIQACRDEDWVRSWLDVHQDAQPAVCIPSDRPRSEWGLGVMDISVLGALETATEMSAVASLGTMNWATLATMIDLGLLGVSESTQAVVCPPSATASEPPVVESEPSKPQPSIGFTIPSEVTKEPSATPSVSRPRTKRTGQKFLPVDATKALAREPWQSPPELMEEHLSEAYRAMNESASETVFGLTQKRSTSFSCCDGQTIRENVQL